MSKTYTTCHAANVAPLVYIYDRANSLLFSPAQLTERMQSLRYSTYVPGGAQSCTFSVPISLGKEMIAHNACRLAVRCGLTTVWEGRIADIKRSTKQGGMAEILGLGIWEHLKQARVTAAGSSGEHADNVIKRVLSETPLISLDQSSIADPNFAVAAMAWTRADLQTIVKDLIDLGDDQTPPRKWEFNVWKSEGKAVTGTYSARTATINDCIYDTTANTWDHGHNTMNIGYSTYAYYSGVRFTELNIPARADVLSATVTFRSAGSTGTDPLHTHIYCMASACPVAMGDLDFATGLILTSASVNWEPSWPAASATIATADITDPVQEIINYSAWNSDSSLLVVLVAQVTAANSVKLANTVESGGSAYAPLLTLAYGPSAEATYSFHAEFVAPQGTAASDVDYIINSQDLASDIEVTTTTEELANYVVAKYGANYTDPAEDATSQDLYDRRENDPDSLDAGTDATLAQAENVRDLYLAEHKNPRWKVANIATQRIRNKQGIYVNPASVRAGCVVRLADFPTLSTDEDRAFKVISTAYDAESGTLTISPVLPQDAVEVQLAKLKQQLTT